MSHEVPDVSLDIESTGDGIRVLLPPRDLGDASRAGLFAVLFGGFGVLFMLTWMAGPLGGGIAMLAKGQQGGWVPILFSALGLFGLAAAIQIVLAGWAVFRNRLCCEVTVLDREIISRERLGWFSFRTRVPVSEIEKLYLRPLIGDLKSKTAPSQIPSFLQGVLEQNRYAIAVREKDGKLVAPAYRLAVLRPLAEAIVGELDRNRVGLAKTTGASAAQGAVQVSVEVIQETVESVDETIEEEDSVLPASSTLKALRHDGVTVYQASSRGLWKGSHGLFQFSLLWNGFLCVFSSTMVFNLPPQPMEALGVIGFISIFWLVGIATLVGAIYLARQKVMVGVDDGRLFVERQTIFGTRWSDFGSAELRGIELGPSGVEVNSVAVMELQVLPRTGKKVGLLSQLEDAELRWLAKRLRDELGLKRLVGSKFRLELQDDGELRAPEGCAVTVSKLPEGAVGIDVPAVGLWSSWSGPLSAIFFAVVPLVGIHVLAANVKIPWQLVLFGSVAFAAFGLTVLLVYYAFRSRSFQIRVSEGELEIRRKGFLARRRVVYGAGEVEDVRAEDTGWNVNGISKCQVVVVPRKGSQFKMMLGRGPDELAYVAALMHRELGLKRALEEDLEDR